MSDDRQGSSAPPTIHGCHALQALCLPCDCGAVHGGAWAAEEKVQFVDSSSLYLHLQRMTVLLQWSYLRTMEHLNVSLIMGSLRHTSILETLIFSDSDIHPRLHQRHLADYLLTPHWLLSVAYLSHEEVPLYLGSEVVVIRPSYAHHSSLSSTLSPFLRDHWRERRNATMQLMC